MFLTSKSSLPISFCRKQVSCRYRLLIPQSSYFGIQHLFGPVSQASSLQRRKSLLPNQFHKSQDSDIEILTILLRLIHFSCPSEPGSERPFARC
jgi:hypothetical protein